MSKNLVIYHKDCFDGFTAAWVFWSMVDKDAEFHPASYGSEPPDVTGKNVYVVDFSYPRETLLKMKEEALLLVVLDHHKTAQKDLEGLDFCNFDMNRSGAGLAWDHFVGSERPWLVDTIEDRDLWKLRLVHTREVMALVAATEMTFEEWSILSSRSIVRVAEEGRAILKYIENYGQKAMEHRRLEKVGSYTVYTMNLSYQNCSDHLNALLTELYDKELLSPKEIPFVASYFRRGDGKWQFSLRSRGEFDVSEIAKSYGGGGHKNAAGFTVNQLRSVFEEVY